MAQFKDLLVFGVTRVMDKLYAKKVVADIEGNADSATKALKDNLNQQIDSTYIKNITGDGTSDTITFTFGDGTTGTFTTKDTQVTVINDHTTGGTTAAYSAEMGKEDYAKIVALENAVMVTNFDTEQPASA